MRSDFSLNTGSGESILRDVHLSVSHNSGEILYVSTRFSLSMEMSRLMQDGTAEPVSRDQILRRERGKGNVNFPCSADHEQDWQPDSVDP